jgi:hypothetical protein
MKLTRLQRFHVGMLTLSGVWALLCLAAPPVDHAMAVTMAIGPLVSYIIVAVLISQLRRDVASL